MNSLVMSRSGIAGSYVRFIFSFVSILYSDFYVTACNRGATAHYIDLNGPTWTRDSSILKASLKVRYVIGTKFPRVSPVFLREL